MKQFALSVFILLLVANSFAQDKRIDSMQAALQKAKSDTDKIKLLLNISETLYCSDTTRRLTNANNALTIAQKTKWRKGEMLAYLDLGNINYHCKHNTDAALYYYNICALIGQTISDSTNRADAYNNMGNIYRSINKHDSALEYYRRCLNLNKDARDQTAYLGNSGTVYVNVGDHIHALQYFEQALKITDSILASPNKIQRDSSTWMVLQLTIGDEYVAMSQLDKALDNYNKELNAAETSHNQLLVMFALTNIGKVYRFKKEYAKAIQYYERSLEASSKLNENNHKPKVLNEMGKLYMETGDLANALKYAQQSQAMSEKTNNAQELVRAFTIIGMVSAKMKDSRKAVDYLQTALNICKKNGLVNEEKDIWEALSSTYKSMGQTDKAFDAYKQFISLRDSIYNVDKAKEMVRMDLQSGFTKIQLADSLKQDETKKVFNLQLQRQRAYTYGGFAGFLLVLSLSFFIYRNYNLQKKANKLISEANETIKKEKQVSENLLLNILPEDVAQELKANGKVHAKLYQQVTVLFTDFVNFTNAGERLTPQELVAELDACFQVFDEIISKYNIEKIKTVGDAYLAVSGLPAANPGHATDIVKAAAEIRDFMIKRKEEHGERTFGIRIGVNSGSVIAGIVGNKKFAYDIWGDTVNIAARMEQSSEVGKVNISAATYELLDRKISCTHRGKINAKNKGVIDMYFVD